MAFEHAAKSHDCNGNLHVVDLPTLPCDGHDMLHDLGKDVGLETSAITLFTSLSGMHHDLGGCRYVMYQKRKSPEVFRVFYAKLFANGGTGAQVFCGLCCVFVALIHFH